MLDPMFGNTLQNPMLGNASPSEQQRAQEEYASQAATKASREMAMALMNRSATQELPKHWAQLLGNVANDAAGAYQFYKANETGLKSAKKSSGDFINQMWGADEQGAVPFAPQAPGVNFKPPPQKMAALGSPPPSGMTPGSEFPPNGPQLPNEGGLTGGLGWNIYWPGMGQ